MGRGFITFFPGIYGQFLKLVAYSLVPETGGFLCEIRPGPEMFLLSFHQWPQAPSSLDSRAMNTGEPHSLAQEMVEILNSLLMGPEQG